MTGSFYRVNPIYVHPTPLPGQRTLKANVPAFGVASRLADLVLCGSLRNSIPDRNEPLYLAKPRVVIGGNPSKSESSYDDVIDSINRGNFNLQVEAFVVPYPRLLKLPSGIPEGISILPKKKLTNEGILTAAIPLLVTSYQTKRAVIYPRTMDGFEGTVTEVLRLPLEYLLLSD